MCKFIICPCKVLCYIFVIVWGTAMCMCLKRLFFNKHLFQHVAQTQNVLFPPKVIFLTRPGDCKFYIDNQQATFLECNLMKKIHAFKSAFIICGHVKKKGINFLPFCSSQTNNLH